MVNHIARANKDIMTDCSSIATPRKITANIVLAHRSAVHRKVNTVVFLRDLKLNRLAALILYL